MEGCLCKLSRNLNKALYYAFTLLKGEVIWVNSNGKYKVNDIVCKIKTEDNKEIDLTLCQEWPIRQPRPVRGVGNFKTTYYRSTCN